MPSLVHGLMTYVVFSFWNSHSMWINWIILLTFKAWLGKVQKENRVNPGKIHPDA
jgi:hypothetical protein